MDSGTSSPRVPLVWKTYHPIHSPRLYGEQILIDTIANGLLESYDNTIPDGMDGAVIAIRANDNSEYLTELNSDLSKLKWCLLIITGNEDGSSFYKQVVHPNKRIWLQTPSWKDEADRYIGLGYPTKVSEFITNKSSQRELNWFFAGQVTHARRVECVKELERLGGGMLVQTSGFNQGLTYEDYISNMARAKIIPCPGGPSTPDTFRLWEALEAGCVPIADRNSGSSFYLGGYWEKVFDGFVPFPTIDDWHELPRVMEVELSKWPHNAITIANWWEAQKQKLRFDLMNDIEKLSNIKS